MTTATLCSPTRTTRRVARAAASNQPVLPFPKAPVVALASSPARERKPSRPVVLQTLPLVSQMRVEAVGPRPEAGFVPGERFARQRLARTVELVGSCIMLLGFLVLAIFA